MKDLTLKFAEVERRVRGLTDENGRLRGRVAELERELAAARRDAGELGRMQGEREQVRQRLERVLRSLEALDTGGRDDGGEGREAARPDGRATG